MGDNLKDKKEILDFYNTGAEIGRFEKGLYKIEFERTKEIILRYLPKQKQVIYDIGGGIGAYSKWLAEMGHEVHLLELAPNAVEYARENYGKFIHSMEVADARNIDKRDESADFVLLMGPMYHLSDRQERLKALTEASRVLKKNGTIIISAISRFSSTLWGLSVFGKSNNLIDEAEFMNMINRELADGQHIRPDKHPYLLARAFFHLPSDLKSEIEDVGLYHEKTLAVEGPTWIVPALDEKWEIKESRENLLAICREVENQEHLMGMSPHLLTIAKKK